MNAPSGEFLHESTSLWNTAQVALIFQVYVLHGESTLCLHFNVPEDNLAKHSLGFYPLSRLFKEYLLGEPQALSRLRQLFLFDQVI